MADPVWGMYRASVVNNNDPLYEARVTLHVPQILGEAESNWALPSAPTVTIPDPGSIVWVSFDGGDVAAPIYQPIGLVQLNTKIDNVAASGTGTTTNIPKQPTGLALSTQPQVAADGTITASITATWTPPTENQDGTSLTNLGGYYVQYSYDNTNWSGGSTTQDSLFTFTNLTIGVMVWVRVAAYTRDANASIWSVTNIQSATSTTAPPIPSTPQVSGALSGIRISWDGNDNTGAAMPPFFSYARLERSVDPGFASPTVVHSFPDAGGYFDSGVGYANSYNYRLVSVSRTGVPSNPTPSQNATAVQVVATDLVDHVVDEVKIATTGLDASQVLKTGTITAASGIIADIKADTIKSGTLDAGVVNVVNLNASNITSGTVSAGHIDAASLLIGGNQVTSPVANANAVPATGVSGTLATTSIPNLDGSKITTGTVPAATNANNVPATGVSGTLATTSIPNLDAGKITGGTFPAGVVIPANQLNNSTIPTTTKIDGGSIVTGTVDASKITLTTSPGNTISGTGSRIQLNANGFYAYNTSGASTVSIDSNGNASFTGTINVGSQVPAGTVQGALATTNIPTLDAGKISGGTLTNVSVPGASVGSGILAGNVAGSLSGATVPAGQLTTGTLASGTVVSTPNNNGQSHVTIDNKGIRLYGTDGVTPTVNLDATTGNGSFTGTITTGSTLAPGTLSGSGLNVTFDNVLAYTNSNPVTGYLVITTGIPFGNYMCAIDITGYNYVSGQADIDAHVNFYAYSTPQILNADFTNTGSCAITQCQLGRDANNHVVIILGTSSQAWQYPKVNIPEVLIGHTAPPSTLGSGWSATITTDLTPYTVMMSSVPSRDINSTNTLTQGWRSPGQTTINGGQITTNSITATQINASTLTIGANQLSSGTIPAGTTLTTTTNASGSKVQIDNNGIRLYGTDGTTVKVNLDATTGSGTFTGQINMTGGSVPGGSVGTGINAGYVTSGTLPTTQVPILDAGKISGGTLNNVNVPGASVGSGISAGNLTGSVTGATVPANQLTTGTIPSTTAISTPNNNGQSHVTMDSNGIRLYGTDGTTVNVNLDATTGSGTFTGQINMTGGSVPGGSVGTGINATNVTGGTLGTGVIVPGSTVGTGINATNVTGGTLGTGVIVPGSTVGSGVNASNLTGSVANATLPATQLTTGTLPSATTITTPNNNGQSHVTIDNKGIRLYGTDGVTATVNLDATTGNGSFTGNVTSSSISGGSINMTNTGALTPPTLGTPTLTTGTSATWASGTALYYKATFTSATGETTGSNEVTITTTAVNQNINLSWSALPAGATATKIYRGLSAGGENLLVTTVSGPTTTFVDSAKPSSSAAVPTSNTSANTNAVFKADANGLYLGNPSFWNAPFRVDMSGNTTVGNALITGSTFKTASSGQRWEISSRVANVMNGYTGVTEESSPGAMSMSADAGSMSTAMFSPQGPGNVSGVYCSSPRVLPPSGPNASVQLSAGVHQWVFDEAGNAMFDGQNMPYGAVAGGKITATSGTTTTGALTAVSCTASFISGRSYKIFTHLNIQSTVANDNAAVKILVNGATVGVGQVPGGLPGANTSFTSELTVWYIPASAQSNVTVAAQFYRTSGTGTLSCFANAGQPAIVLVEDIGKI